MEGLVTGKVEPALFICYRVGSVVVGIMENDELQLKLLYIKIRFASVRVLSSTLNIDITLKRGLFAV